MDKRFIFFILFFTLGCSSIQVTKEVARRILGTSPEALRNIEEKYSSVVSKDLSYCYQETLDALKDMSALAYLHNRQGRYIVGIQFNTAFKNCGQMTEVGIFFREISSNQTEVTLTSPNFYLAEFISSELFTRLNKSLGQE